jgi:2-iminobutanoate/2-iminopropanoate deaminase
VEVGWPVEPVITTQGHQHVHNQAQGTAWGPLLFFSAVRGTHPETRQVDADMLVQARQCFRNLSDLLEAAGSDVSRVLRVGMYLTDLQGDRQLVNTVWHEVFGEVGPARFAVQVADMGGRNDHSRLLLDAFAVRTSF